MDDNFNQESLNTLFIRTYTTQLKGHTHNYYQLTIPLMGRINMIVENQRMIVNYGEALILPKGVFHQFQADETFRFLIVNLSDISFLSSNESHFSLDEKTLSYLTIIEKQLLSAFDPQINDRMLSLLLAFLQPISLNKTMDKKIDNRLIRVINVIKNEIGAEHTVKSLAKVACLSESHFKMLFKQQLGCTPQAYISELRMQMARGLIINTDMPISLVAEKCGYYNVSAFIRRFNQNFHQTPQKFRQNNLY